MPQFRSRLSLTILVVAVCSLTAFAGAEPRVKVLFDRSFKVGGPVELEVHLGSGDARVRVGEAGTVRVKGTTQLKADRAEPGREEQVRSLEANPPIRQEGNRLWIGTSREEKPAGSISIDYEIETPAETRLTVESSSGDQWIEAVRGPVSVKSESGDIRISSVPGVIAIQTESGDVRLEKSGTGAVSVETSSGDVSLALPEEGGFDISARTSSGTISVNPSLQVESQTPAEVRAKARGGGSAVAIQTSSGDIRID